MKMNHPWWKIKHDWWIDDLNFERGQRQAFVEMLQRHPDDDIGVLFREAIALLDKKIKRIKISYKKIYGIYPKI